MSVVREGSTERLCHRERDVPSAANRRHLRTTKPHRSGDEDCSRQVLCDVRDAMPWRQLPAEPSLQRTSVAGVYRTSRREIRPVRLLPAVHRPVCDEAQHVSAATGRRQLRTGPDHRPLATRRLLPVVPAKVRRHFVRGQAARRFRLSRSAIRATEEHRNGQPVEMQRLLWLVCWCCSFTLN